MSSPSRHELVQYRLAKAKQTLTESELLIHNEMWNSAINRLYYACFYAVTAILATVDVHTKTHAGAKQQFALHFVKNGTISDELNRFYIKVFSMRQSGDYEDYCDYAKEDVLELLEPAQTFISSISALIGE